MNKSVLSFIFFFAVALNGLYAQCTPNTTITQPGIYPDSATGIPHAIVGQPYSTVVQIRVLTDTMVNGLHATVDSIVLISVVGLPSGFTYGCNPVSQSFPARSNGCIFISGNPMIGMEGSHPLTFNITAYGKLFGVTPISDSYSITYFDLHIDPSNVGVPEFNTGKFVLSQNIPDPVTSSTDIYYNVPASSRLDFKMYNLLGKLVYQKTFFAEQGVGKISLDAKDFAQGIYMYNLSNGKATLSKRMVMAYN